MWRYCCRTVPVHSFLDYIAGGCEIELMVAVDFTVSVIKMIEITIYSKKCNVMSFKSSILLPISFSRHQMEILKIQSLYIIAMPTR